MKKQIFFRPAYILSMIGVCLIVMTGCNDDFFDQQAGDRITADQHYKTLEDVSVSMRGAIIPLQDFLPKLIMAEGLLSDMMDVTANSDAYLQQIHLHALSADNPFIDPSDLYKVIININEVLANIDRIEDRRFDSIIAPQVKGALIGMRAWTYFTIARFYGHAAIIDDNMTSIPANLNQQVMAKEELIDLLIEQVKPHIHDPAQTQFVEVWFPNYVNTKALLGELYLEKNDYANAVTYLKLACESYLNQPALLKVDRTYQNAGWSSIFLNAETQVVENISVMPFSSRENQNNPLANWMIYDYKVKPSSVLVDSFMVQLPAAGDPGDIWRGNGYSITIDTIAELPDGNHLKQTFITKYAVDVNDPMSSDIIISRASDVHLLLAEALNRLGDATSQTYAVTLLNNGFNSLNPKPAPYTRWASNLGIRGRVYLKPRLIPDDITGMERTLLIEDMIMAERALELAFEGKRWTDLIRIATRRSDPEYLAAKVAAKFEGTNQYDMIRNKLLDPANWYLPSH